MESDKKFTVLIVDDSPVNVKLLETTLAKDGYLSLSAFNGATAREMAEAERPDLILLDIRMPGEDGFSVIKFLKTNPLTAAIPVIFLTGVSEIEAKLSGFELGAVDYITKPFHPREVLARVRLHLKLSIATNSMITSQAEKLKQITEAQAELLAKPAMKPEAQFGVHYQTLQEAGGDFYDVLHISRDIFGYFVADFSGHDIKTSYLTAAVKALLKQNSTPVYEPWESIKLTNDVLIEVLPEGKYLTACYVRLNRKTGKMVVINAGHPPAVYVPIDGEPRLLEVEGDILGMFRDVYFGSLSVDVQQGDRFFMYSDGLIESNREKRIWAKGSEALLAACEQVRSVPIHDASRQLASLLLKDLETIEDDVVVLGGEV